MEAKMLVLLLFAFILFMLSVVIGWFWDVMDEKGKAGEAVASGALAVFFALAIFDLGLTKGCGRADYLTSLDSGVYAVRGDIKTDTGRALWLMPLDSTNFSDGKLYELPSEMNSKEFGPYVQKKGKELVPFAFEKKSQ